jgi:hypothetical protein
MNAIFFYNLTAQNGWRWRFEIITASDTLLSSPQYIEIPDNIIGEEITWQAKFPNAPLGLSDTPSVKLMFNMENLSATPGLEYLRSRLESPFLVFDMPFPSAPNENYQVYNPETNDFEPATVQGGAPQVAKIRLTNVLRVMTDYGNPNTANFDSIRATNDNAENSTIVFSGVQAFSPAGEDDLLTSALTIEFMHLNRYVLEQINPSVVDAQMKTIAPAVAASVILTGWKDSASARRIEIHQTSGDDYSYQSLNIQLYPVQALFSAVSNLFVKVRQHLIRQSGFAWNGFETYLNFARFYRINMDTGLQGTVLNTGNLYFIGRIYPSYTDGGTFEAVGGTFSQGSKFWGYKNMFDFFVDLAECGTKELYRETGFSAQLLKTSLIIPPSATIELTRDTIGLDSQSTRQYAALSGFEVAVAENTIALSNFGRALVEDTFNFEMYFHNSFRQWEYSFCPDNTNSPTVRGYGTDAAALEGQLFYLDGPARVIAVHPACDFENETGYEQDLFQTGDTISPSAFAWLYPRFLGIGIFNADEGFDLIQEKMSEYLARWQANFGIARLVGGEIVAHLSSDRQRKFSGSYNLKIGRIASGSPVTDVQMPMPRNLGRRYTLEIAFFPSWRNVPTSRIFILSSELDITNGLSKNEFFAQDLPVTFIPL